MGKRVQRIPSWPGVKRFTPTKAVYICADQLVTSSHFACGEAADHTFRFAGQSGVIRRSDARYALDAKAAIFRRAWRLLPALAAILIPASVLSKKSAMLSRSASERISLCFFALVSTRISV